MPGKRLNIADRWLSGVLAVLFICVGGYLVAVWLSDVSGFHGTSQAIRLVGTPLGAGTIITFWVLVIIRLIKRASNR